MERNYRSTAGRLMRWTVGGIAAAALGLAAVQLASAEETITMASTTSTEQSGLFKHLLPEKYSKSNETDVKIEVKKDSGAFMLELTD